MIKIQNMLVTWFNDDDGKKDIKKYTKLYSLPNENRWYKD